MIRSIMALRQLNAKDPGIIEARGWGVHRHREWLPSCTNRGGVPGWLQGTNPALINVNWHLLRWLQSKRIPLHFAGWTPIIWGVHCLELFQQLHLSLPQFMTWTQLIFPCEDLKPHSYISHTSLLAERFQTEKYRLPLVNTGLMSINENEWQTSLWGSKSSLHYSAEMNINASYWRDPKAAASHHNHIGLLGIPLEAQNPSDRQWQRVWVSHHQSNTPGQLVYSMGNTLGCISSTICQVSNNWNNCWAQQMMNGTQRNYGNWLRSHRQIAIPLQIPCITLTRWQSPEEVWDDSRKYLSADYWNHPECPIMSPSKCGWSADEQG